ncbi:MexH family multidrug efflux RND transporter periplasmic adaptor subunit [Pseudodesulfovibrio nedwellii]|uniref:MexH family multidrug efflux RND transporter periplasmic adaptor subunit n=1 Tax=Pseudodesulfovibrio nedwellii TaxID=2973072 RepID=A0ABN6S1T4_9BACT|nr:efflux RND transporter periplasmic adaptor subunit [Pseudodesulfovibrio nedwellii]BDQ35851.1 MexH family multidrug efflux RND transporter periplasmic adaptor subunit [Pseudodesulfovibrio nedwellii]
MRTLLIKARAIFGLKVIIPVCVVILAAAGAYATVVTAPKAKKRPPVFIAPAVDTKVISCGTYRVWLPVMGTVTAARSITLEARVSGEVESISSIFTPGGYFEKGEQILTISPEDYQLALREVQAEVTTAEYDLKVEQGYQTVSAREWKLLSGSTKGTEAESELALRKPHLAKAQAELQAAQAKLRQAMLDLERTKISAPFSAMVQEKSVDIGAMISPQESLATLVGTDEFWIEASVPVDRLHWINIPSAGTVDGSKARISSGSGVGLSVREGQVVRLLPSLESEGRMARLLISVKDPLNIAGRPNVKPLLLGSYVSVEIDGGVLENVMTIPRSAYHDNDKVWIMTEANTLEIRSLKSVWRDEGTIVVAEGLVPGEVVVTSALSTPLQGMRLRSISTAVDTNVVEKPNRVGVDAGKGKGPGKGQGGGMNNG